MIITPISCKTGHNVVILVMLTLKQTKLTVVNSFVFLFMAELKLFGALHVGGRANRG